MLIKVLSSAAILTLLYNILVMGYAPGLGLSFFIIALNLYLYFLREQQSKTVQSGLFFSVVSSIFALLYAYRASSIVQTISLVTAVATLGIAGYLYKSEARFSYTEKIILYPLFLFFRSIAAIGEVFKTGQSLIDGKKQDTSTTQSVLRGLLFAVPLVLILMGILNSADPIFNTVLVKFFSQIGERSLISLGVFLVGLLLAFAKLRVTSESVEAEVQAKESTVELSVVIGSIGVVFATFILVQVKYLFSSIDERGLAELGISSITYSEYVRKGFFELIAAALVASSVLVFILKYLRNIVVTQSVRILQYTGAVVSFETLVILASAAKRLSLYAEAHGLTRARIFGFVFLVWLAVIVILFIGKLLQKLHAREFFIAITGATVLSLFALSAVNIDKIIALHYQPTVNDEIDYYYIAKLSPDAVAGWHEALLDADVVLTSLEQKAPLTADDNRKLFYIERTLNFIDHDVRQLEGERPWQASNLSELTAQVYIKNNPAFEKIGELQERVKRLQLQVSQEAQQSTQIDRSIDQPLSE